MRRLAGVLSTVVLLAGGGALALTGTTGAGVVDPTAPTLRVHKTVSGTSTTGFAVSVQCLTGGLGDGVAPVVLPFLADGTPDTTGVVPAGWTSSNGDWLLETGALLGDTCTVFETDQGAATSVSYSCAYSEGATPTEVGPSNGSTGCPGAASGPSPTPAAVTYPDSCVAAECHLIAGRVTVTNTMPTITVGPTASAPGGTVTISGTGCLQIVVTDVAVDVAAAGIVTGTIAFTPPLAFGPVSAQADGTWSVGVVVPPGTPVGSYAVDATCTLPVLPGELSALATGTFSYPRQLLTVAVAATPRFTG